MQTFTCPQCGEKSTFDPFVESACCPACGYEPSIDDPARPFRRASVARPSYKFMSEIDRATTRVPGDSVTRIYNAAKEALPHFIFLVRLDDYLYTFGSDAQTLIDVCGPETRVDEAFESVQPPTARVPLHERDRIVRQVEDAGHRIGLVRYGVLTCPQCGHRNRTRDIEFPSYECSRCGYVPPERDQLAGKFIEAGIEAVQAGDLEKAQVALKTALEHRGTPDQQATALMWLAEATPNLGASQEYLAHALTLSPSEAVASRVRGRLADVEAVMAAQGSIAPSEEGLPETASGRAHRPIRAERFVCPQCGGGMRYEPESRDLFCRHCGHHQSVGSGQDGGDVVREQPFLAAMAGLRGHARPVEARTFQCSACGASFLLAPETLSLTCPYCASDFGLEKTAFEALIPPHGLIPFSVSEAEAEEALARWLEGSPPAEDIMPPVGLYLPAWTFDLGGFVGWSCEVRVGWSMLRLSPYASRSGIRSVLYDDVPVPASRQLDAALTDAIDEFDLTELVPYEPEYLADWPAGIYEIAMSDAAIEARVKALKRFEAFVVDAYDEVRDVRLKSSGLRVESYKLILLPVWIAHAVYEGERYMALVNGQQGAVRGQRPESEGRGASG